MSSPARNSLAQPDRGAVTAEFAVVFPSLVLMLAGLIGIFQLGLSQLQLAELAVETARGLARGESDGWVTQLLERAPLVVMAREDKDALSCVRLTLPIGLSAKACAVDAH